MAFQLIGELVFHIAAGRPEYLRLGALRQIERVRPVFVADLPSLGCDSAGRADPAIAVAAHRHGDAAHLADIRISGGQVDMN